MTKLLVNGEEQDVDLQLDKLFVKINGEYYVKTINIEKQILSELKEWLKEQLMYFCENNEQGGFSTNIEDLEMILDKIQKLKEKYK